MSLFEATGRTLRKRYDGKWLVVDPTGFDVLFGRDGRKVNERAPSRLRDLASVLEKASIRDRVSR